MKNTPIEELSDKLDAYAKKNGRSAISIKELKGMLKPIMLIEKEELVLAYSEGREEADRNANGEDYYKETFKD